MSFSAKIKRFFPDVRVEHGPFGLLGIPVAPINRDSVYVALRDRLRQLDSSADDDPDMDFVRDALHVAAAQIADTDIQDALLAQFRAAELVAGSPLGEQPDHQRAKTAGGSAVAALTAEDHAVLRYLLASSGGWNRSASRKVARFAVGHGLTMRDLRIALGTTARAENTKRGVIDPRRSVPLTETSRAHSTAKQELYAEPSDPTTKYIINIMTVCLILSSLVLGSLTLTAVIERRAAIAQADREIESIESLARADTLAEASRLDADASPAPLDALDAFGILSALDVPAFEQDPTESTAQFEHAIRSLSLGWDRLPPQLLESVPLIVRDAVFAAHDAANTSSDDLIDAILQLTDASNAEVSPDVRVRGWVFGSGLVSSLRASTVPAPAAARLAAAETAVSQDDGPLASTFAELLHRNALSAAWNLPFEVGEESQDHANGLRAEWARLLIDLDVSNPLSEPRGIQALRKMADRSGEEPTASVAEAVARAVLTHADDDDIGAYTQLIVELAQHNPNQTPLAAAVVRGMFRSARWDGLTPRIVPEQWLPAERRRLVALIERATGLNFKNPTDAVAAQWVDVYELARQKMSTTPVQSIGMALAVSKLNEAAIAAWAGDTDGALLALEQAASAQARVDAVQAPLGFSYQQEWWYTSGPTGWAEQWFAEPTPESRIANLERLRADGGPSTSLEYDLLAASAIGPSRAFIREAAGSVLALGEPNRVLLASLKYLAEADDFDIAFAFLTPFVSSATDPANSTRAVNHRAALESLAERIAADRVPRIDTLSDELEDSAAKRAAAILDSIQADQSTGSADSAAHALRIAHTESLNAAALRGGLRGYANPGSAGHFSSAAVNGLHNAIAERAFAASALSRTIAIEYPDRADSARDVFKSLRRTLAESATATDQLLTCELAIARLWAIRLGWETP